LEFASNWWFWFFFIIYQRLVRLSYRGVGFDGSILAADEGTLFRRDDHPKGRQFARSSGHWKSGSGVGGGGRHIHNTIMTEAIWRYNRICVIKKSYPWQGKKTTHIIYIIREPRPTIEYKPYKWRGGVWCGDRRLFPQTIYIYTLYTFIIVYK